MKGTILRNLILTTILFASCVSTKTFLKNDQIPEDFGKGNKTILVMPFGDKKVDRAVEAAFEKYYKGSYEIGVGSKSNGKSGSTIGYTFNTYESYTPGGYSAAGRNLPSTAIYFGITDLTTNKTYKNLRYGNYIKFYLTL